MTMMDTVLPDSILCKHVCAIGPTEQLRLCVTLILIQEKPTGFHSRSLSTNHASSRFLSPQFAPNVDTNPSLFSFLSFFFFFFTSPTLSQFSVWKFFWLNLVTFLLENFVKNKQQPCPSIIYLLWQLII